MRRLLITVQMGLMLIVGCGQATYDERLEKRISELKNPPPAAAENDAQDDGDEETTEEEDAEEAGDEG